jgi:serine/threonine protein kinase
VPENAETHFLHDPVDWRHLDIVGEGGMVVATSGDFGGNARFRVVRRIGAGGMGVVYEAEDLQRGQRVALKTLRSTDSNTLYRLKREFRALADLHHPNLVSLYELVVGEECFFTMELIHGSDFAAWVRGVNASADTLSVSLRQDKFDEERLRAVLPQLVRGLTALHDAGQVHRDVKPSNVLVSEEGRAVLVDFGLVTKTDPIQPESFDGHIAGTVGYMAPEQCRGELKISAAADFYAFGAMVYEVLTGRLPFDGPVMQVLVEKQQQAAHAARSLAPNAPEDLAELCDALLARAPADRPTAKEILQRLGVEDSRSSKRTRLSLFAGRSDELSRLADSLERMPAVTLVRGPSGIGKSAVCQRFLEGARAQNANLVVLQGRCYERETVPFQAMDSLIDHLSQFWLSLPAKDAGTLLPRDAALLQRLFPVLGRVPCVAEAPRARDGLSPQEQRTRAFAALREVLQRLGERRSLVLVLDDIQWVDANTLTVLADLMRPPDPPRLLLLLLTRSEGGEALEAVVRQMDATQDQINLSPLSESTSAELAAGLLGGRDLAVEVAREAGGNPFFICELVQYLQGNERAQLGALRLDEVIGQRIGQLSAASRRLLQLVALAGEPISRHALASALGLSPQQIADEAGVLRTLRFIRAAGTLSEERVEPYHDRIRDAALASLDDDSRRACHRVLALAYEEHAALSAEQLARHWSGAGEAARAAGHARRAAEQALGRLDFARAADLYQMAIELGAPTGENRRELYTALGGALSNAGRALESAEALLFATDGADPATHIELRRRSAEELLRGGYMDEGLKQLSEVLAGFGLQLARTPLGAVASILFRRAWLWLRGLRWRSRSVSDLRPTDLAKLDVLDTVATSLGFVDTIRGFDFQVRGLLQALKLGEPDRLARALGRECAYLAGLGQLPRARRAMAVADRVAAESGSAYARALVMLGHGVVSYFSTLDWPKAHEQLLTAEKLWLAQGRAGWEVDTAQLHQAFSLNYLGELKQLAQRIPAWIREAERRGDQYASVNFRARLSITWLIRDEPERAAEELRAAIDSWLPEEKGFCVQHYWALLGRGDLALYRDTPEEAERIFRESEAPVRRSQFLRLPIVRVELAYLAGRIALARAARGEGALLDAARRHRRRLARERLPLAGWLGELLDAAIAAVAQRTYEAIGLYEGACRSLEAAGMKLHLAAARRRMGELRNDKALIAEADGWYRGEGVVAPAKMTRMLVPAK